MCRHTQCVYEPFPFDFLIFNIMKKVFYDSWLARMLLHFSDCHTIMLFGFVFSKQKESEMTQATRNHECVHARQWFEVCASSGCLLLALVLAFGISPWWMLLSGMVYYVWYVIEWMVRGMIYSVLNDDWDCVKRDPYKNLSFEREARFSERDADYLENSNYFAWLKEL